MLQEHIFNVIEYEYITILRFSKTNASYVK